MHGWSNYYYNQDAYVQYTLVFSHVVQRTVLGTVVENCMVLIKDAKHRYLIYAVAMVESGFKCVCVV